MSSLLEGLPEHVRASDFLPSLEAGKLVETVAVLCDGFKSMERELGQMKNQFQQLQSLAEKEKTDISEMSVANIERDGIIRSLQDQMLTSKQDVLRVKEDVTKSVTMQKMQSAASASSFSASESELMGGVARAE